MGEERLSGGANAYFTPLSKDARVGDQKARNWAAKWNMC